MKSAQLQLINTEQSWKLDEHTIEVGRAGIAAARAALANAATPSVESDDGQLAMTLIDKAA
jgi:hypothetical protein